MAERYTKTYVSVNVDIDEDGTMLPRLIRWMNGRVFAIEQLGYKCRASSAKVGGGGIRYTVPASIDPKLVQDDLVLRFRVGGVMKKRVVKLYLGDEAVVSRKRPVMAPGEMEELKLTKDMLAAHPGLSRIHITVEEA